MYHTMPGWLLRTVSNGPTAELTLAPRDDAGLLGSEVPVANSSFTIRAAVCPCPAGEPSVRRLSASKNSYVCHAWQLFLFIVPSFTFNFLMSHQNTNKTKIYQFQFVKKF